MSLGASVHTPSFDSSFYQSDQSYTITLLLPAPEELGEGSLVIRLEVDTKEEVTREEEATDAYDWMEEYINP